jgi:hypothetical protein
MPNGGKGIENLPMNMVLEKETLKCTPFHA